MCLIGDVDFLDDLEDTREALETACILLGGNNDTTSCATYLDLVLEGELYDGYEIHFKVMASGGDDLWCLTSENEDEDRIGSICLYMGDNKIGFGTSAIDVAKDLAYSGVGFSNYVYSNSCSTAYATNWCAF